MQQVSNSYKEQIKKDVRNISHMRIRFSIVDPDAVRDVTISDNGEMPWATLPDYNNEEDVLGRYGTFEPGYWLLDGTRLTMGAEENIYQAFVSDKISDASCNYSTPPSITIQFSEDLYAFGGMSFYFDTIGNDYPSTIRLEGYADNTKIMDKYIIVPQARFDYRGHIPETTGGRINKLVISFNTSTLPYHRLRLEDIVLGINMNITGDTLIDSTWSRSNDLMNTVLDDNSFSFTFYDPNKDYNPDNPEGIWEYLEAGQDVQFDYGYELDNGTIEWVKGCRLYTTGETSITNGDTLPQVTINATSLLQRLEQLYSCAEYIKGGISLYQLAFGLLNGVYAYDTFDRPMFELDDKLKNYRFYGILEERSVKDVLQLVANAGMCLMYIDRDGKIIIKDRETVQQNFVYDDMAVKDRAPMSNKYPYLKDLSVKVTEYTVSSTIEEITTLDVQDAHNDEFVIEYDIATDITIEVRQVEQTASVATFAMAKARAVKKDVVIHNAVKVPTGTARPDTPRRPSASSFPHIDSWETVGALVFPEEEEPIEPEPPVVPLTIDETLGVYTTRTMVKATGTGTIVIKGKKVIQNEYTVTKHYNDVGDDCELESALVSNRAHALEYLDWMGEMLTKRDLYSFDDRGFPEIDITDNVGIDTAFTESKRCFVQKIDVNYNGGLSGKVEVIS